MANFLNYNEMKNWKKENAISGLIPSSEENLYFSFFDSQQHRFLQYQFSGIIFNILVCKEIQGVNIYQHR